MELKKYASWKVVHSPKKPGAISFASQNALKRASFRCTMRRRQLDQSAGCFPFRYIHGKKFNVSRNLIVGPLLFDAAEIGSAMQSSMNK